ncbi:MAG: hypothetical protein A2901_03340 [Elusimicrobia bacterium RIFCSPLOWO2_01_FULL_54_10]|nr:MAG: hypothetical protein A2901_03340 [Elusimicrobia bacterium RIFCSPLOWO2_01_FULL_54_10]
MLESHIVKTIFSSILFIFSAAPAWALTAAVDRIDTNVAYTAYEDTQAVKYVDRCMRGQLKAYEWKTWEGYYSARAYMMPLAVVTVRREENELFGGDISPFIDKAQAEAAKIGANIFCYVRIKKNQDLQETETMIFRAYKQLFQAGNSSWEAFFKDIMNKGVLLTLQDLQLGEKTREALEKYNAPPKK